MLELMQILQSIQVCLLSDPGEAHTLNECRFLYDCITLHSNTTDTDAYIVASQLPFYLVIKWLEITSFQKIIHAKCIIVTLTKTSI